MSISNSINNKKISIGDRIRLFLEDKTIEGILMPTPELIDSDDLIIKLENGYNLGISKKKIKKIEILEKYKKQDLKNKDKENKKDQERLKLPNVSILSTGGTISSKIDYRTGGVYADYTADDFLEMMPELKEIANIKAKKVLSLMSEDMLPRDWLKISSIIAEEIKNGSDGIVITHGTDTMHFTSAALSFFFEKHNVPIIITGSQRSIDRGSSDAFLNLICSVKAAAELNIGEVMTCMHGSTNDDYCLLIRGTKVRKMHTSRRDAFRPINDLAIAKVFSNKIEILNDFIKADKNKKKEFVLKNNFEENIALIYVYPGLEPDIINFYLEKKVKGIVIAATALGHVNTWTEKSLLPNLKKCFEKKVPVFITSQTLYGSVNPYVYTNLRKLSVEAKAIYLNDLMPETAYIKLGWALAQEKDSNKIIELMLKNVKREFNDKITDKMFLN
ncbi:MAG: Glu-tRNA(Gln) amidotransferase subunit GatD [Candidatus Woesearchaeota archaeon]